MLWPDHAVKMMAELVVQGLAQKDVSDRRKPAQGAGQAGEDAVDEEVDMGRIARCRRVVGA